MLKNFSQIKSWIKKNHVTDVILFGSSVRGKSQPSDVDLCILIKDSDEKKSLNLIDSLGILTDQLKLKSHLNILTSSDFLSGNTLAKTLLQEGISIKNGKNFSQIFGLTGKSLFIYSLKHFSPSRRVQFHYLLQGRYGSAGILKKVSGEFLGTGSILIPVAHEDLFKEILNQWKVKYTVKHLLI